MWTKGRELVKSPLEQKNQRKRRFPSGTSAPDTVRRRRFCCACLPVSEKTSNTFGQSVRSPVRHQVEAKRGCLVRSTIRSLRASPKTRFSCRNILRIFSCEYSPFSLCSCVYFSICSPRFKDKDKEVSSVPETIFTKKVLLRVSLLGSVASSSRFSPCSESNVYF